MTNIQESRAFEVASGNKEIGENNSSNPGESKQLIDPDTTGIDTKADKTKKEIFPVEQKIKH